MSLRGLFLLIALAVAPLFVAHGPRGDAGLHAAEVRPPAQPGRTGGPLVPPRAGQPRQPGQPGQPGRPTAVEPDEPGLETEPGTRAKGAVTGRGEDAGFLATGGDGPGDKTIVMDFNDVDIRVFIKFISELTGRNFVVDEGVRGTVTILSPRSISLDEVYRVFESVLEVHGYTVITQGEVVKIVPSKTSRSRNLPLFGGESDPASPADRMVTQIVPLKNADSTELRTMLAPMVSPDGLITDNPSTATLIVIDYAPNVTRIQRIIEDMDVSLAKLVVIRLHNAEAGAIAERVNKLWQQRPQKKGGGAHAVSLVADERTNAVLFMAGPEDARQIKELVGELDQPVQKRIGNYKVYGLKYANAEEMAKVLNELVGRAAAVAQGKEEGKVQTVSGSTKIVADKGTNSLLISASPLDFPFFDDIIAELDVPRRQVYVEALIMEISADKTFSLGVNWNAAGKVANIGDNPEGGLVTGAYLPDGYTSAFNSSGVLTPPTGFSVGMVSFPVTIGDIVYTNLQALITASKTDNSFNIISTPQLMTLDNEEATITVAENRPFLTASDSGQNQLDRTYQRFEYKDVGTTLKITPQINKGDAIRLKIKQETSRVDKVETAETGALQPTTRKRTTETTVQVGNGQTLVISGLIGEDKSEGQDKVPFLGDIPIIGQAFKKRSSAGIKTNLFVFITPRVTSAPRAMDAVTEEKRAVIEKARVKADSEAGETPFPDNGSFGDKVGARAPVQKPPKSYGPALK